MKAYMALLCKKGSCTKVLDELIKMRLTKKNVFVLFGPTDILIQLHELDNFNEFITKWFNPIRAITPENPMIEKSQTFIVISEGKSFNEEPYAFLFLNTQPRNLENVQEALQKMPEVLSADTVFGPYDVICAVRVGNKNALKQLVERIEEEIPNIQEIATEIVAPLY